MIDHKSVLPLFNGSQLIYGSFGAFRIVKNSAQFRLRSKPIS